MYKNNELVYLLDLCIFAYQLHSQTLIWPMDPYYERLDDLSGHRKKIMKSLHEHSEKYKEYRGPGSFTGLEESGWDTNNGLDPIISDYKLIYPWRPGFTNSMPGEWIVYNTPNEITDNIGRVYIAKYSSSAGPYHNDPQVEVDTLYSKHPNRADATSLLYCFEGGTGSTSSTKEKDFPHAWSLMGYVLAEETGNQDGEYNVFIVFRGSRSGELRKMNMVKGMTIGVETGNPDWMTDLRYEQEKVIAVNTSVECSLGNALSMKRMLPVIWKCLVETHKAKGGISPRRVYVCGHSLGGALAVHFTSAVNFGLVGTIPKELRAWPWRELKLVTFGAPVVEREPLIGLFNSNGLNSIRVWLKGDPVAQTHFDPTEWLTPGLEVGMQFTGKSSFTKGELHSPDYIRIYLIRHLKALRANTLGSDEEEIDVPFSDAKEDEIDKFDEDVLKKGMVPWKGFKSFQDTLKYFQVNGKVSDLSNSLNDLNVRYALLLSSLKYIFNINSDKLGRDNYESLGNTLKSHGFGTDLPDDKLDGLIVFLEWWAEEINREEEVSESYRIFLQNCLILVFLGKNQRVLDVLEKESYDKFKNNKGFWDNFSKFR